MKCFTQEEFIEKAKSIHPEYDYSKSQYQNRRTKIVVICSMHGEFSITPGSLFNGSGCMLCGREQNALKCRKNKIEFINEAKQYFPDYDYSMVEYKNNDTKILLGCPIHGNFYITPSSILRGSGCIKCANSQKKHVSKYTTESFIEKSKLIHPEYDYSRVKYIGSKRKIQIMCRKHGLFEIVPDSLLRGKGCYECGREKTINSVKKNNDSIIKEFKNIKPEYDYSRVIYLNNQKKVNVICKKHGSFYISPVELLRGRGCAECTLEKLGFDEKGFFEKAKQISPEYDYSKVSYVNAHTKILVGCIKHGDFYITPNKLLMGQGCSVCNESKGERFIRNWLISHKIDFESQKHFQDLRDSKTLSYDFFISEKKLLIEFNGKQHYEYVEYFHNEKYDFERQIKHDLLKKEYARKKQYELLIIPYWEYDNIPIYLEKYINNV